MKRYFIFLICFVEGFFTSCQEPAPYIIATDIQKIFDLTNFGEGLTVEEDSAFMVSMYDSVQLNTIGKTIPEIMVKNLANRSFNLQNVLTGNLVIISSDAHCAFGYENLTNTFPKAMKRLEAANKPIRVVCLVKKTPYDYEDSLMFIQTLRKTIPIYKEIYVIDEQEAYKINLFGNTVRLYVNEEKVVANMKLGSSSEDNLYEELKRNTKF